MSIQVERTENKVFDLTEIFVGERLDVPIYRFCSGKIIRLRQEKTLTISLPSMTSPADLDTLRDYANLVQRVLMEAEQFQHEIDKE